MADGVPTVLVQADNTWRTLAAAVAVGMRGGVIAVVSRHADASEFAIALEDIVPDAVHRRTRDARALGGLDGPTSPASDASLDGWSLLPVRRGTTRGVERWRGGVAVAMTSGSTGRPKCVVQSESALRYAGAATIDAVGLRPGDAVGALVPLSSVAAFCFGMYLPAMLGGTDGLPRQVEAGRRAGRPRRRTRRWTMLVPTMALQLSIRPGCRQGSLRA